MSELLIAAAAALGIPEDLVQRSAAARATADGTTADTVLAAWAGGAPLDAPAAAVDDAVDETPAPVIEVAAPAPAATPQMAAPAPAPATAPAAVAVATRPSRDSTPILDGQEGHPMSRLVMILGLFGLGLLIAVTLPATTGGDYNHLVPDAQLSAAGQAGQDVYLEQGCWYCHTQLVRPLLADVGLGPVTETFADSLDTAAFGLQRIGPDLAHVGARTALSGGDEAVTRAEIEILLTDPQVINPDGLHPSYGYLSENDLQALTTYLLELK